MRADTAVIGWLTLSFEEFRFSALLNLNAPNKYVWIQKRGEQVLFFLEAMKESCISFYAKDGLTLCGLYSLSTNKNTLGAKREHLEKKQDSKWLLQSIGDHIWPH